MGIAIFFESAQVPFDTNKKYAISYVAPKEIECSEEDTEEGGTETRCEIKISGYEGPTIKSLINLRSRHLFLPPFVSIIDLSIGEALKDNEVPHLIAVSDFQNALDMDCLSFGE